MSITPTPNHYGDPMWLADVIRAYGVKVVEMKGWKTWGNGDFGKIKGIIVHHTGGNSTSPSYIRNNPQLGNGLSSQIHLSRSGVATMCGVGVAWHAGRGSYTGWQTNNANWESIGIEAESDGVSAWPAAELDAYYRICAAILYKLGKRATTQSLLSHWEYSLKAQGKWDPGAGNGKAGALMDMEHFRARVNWYIDNPPWKTAPKPEPKPAATPIDPLKKVSEDVSKVLEQLAGVGRDDAGNINYSGWLQLGKKADGTGLTLVDGLAAVRQNLIRIESKLDALLNALKGLK